MEFNSQGNPEIQPQPPSGKREPIEDTDVRTPIMNRDKREKALAWAQAYRLIRGGVDEVVEMIEGSQYTIEVLLQALREATCRACELERGERPLECESCRAREKLLAQLI
jgi:hypothetical protein